MLEKMKENLELLLKKAECQLLFVEDAYRMQTLLDDIQRNIDAYVEQVDEMVKELEAA